MKAEFIRQLHNITNHRKGKRFSKERFPFFIGIELCAVVGRKIQIRIMKLQTLCERFRIGHGSSGGENEEITA